MRAPENLPHRDVVVHDEHGPASTEEMAA